MEQEEALRAAAQKGDDLTVKKLLGLGVKQTANEVGDTPLLLATSCYVTEPSFVEVVRSLLVALQNEPDSKAIDHHNQEGNAAIHNTAFRGSMEILELLLIYGADFEHEGELGMVPLALAATKKHHACVNVLVKKLVEEKKFSQKQTEWMHLAENEYQQLHIYRALTSIFREKPAMNALLEFDVIGVIIKGIKRFKKTSVQSSGLQLLRQCLNSEKGLELARKLDVVANIKEACKDSIKDQVISHLIKEIEDNL